MSGFIAMHTYFRCIGPGNDFDLLIRQHLPVGTPVTAVLGLGAGPKTAIKGNPQPFKNPAKPGGELFIADDLVDQQAALAVRVFLKIGAELAPGEILCQRQLAAGTVIFHVVIRQRLFPGISFHTKLEVAVPDSSRDPVPDDLAVHVSIKKLALNQLSENPSCPASPAVPELGKRVEVSLVVTRHVRFDTWKDRRKHIILSTVGR